MKARWFMLSKCIQNLYFCDVKWFITHDFSSNLYFFIFSRPKMFTPIFLTRKLFSRWYFEKIIFDLTSNFPKNFFTYNSPTVIFTFLKLFNFRKPRLQRTCLHHHSRSRWWRSCRRRINNLRTLKKFRWILFCLP